MKILIFGSNGMVGSAISKILKDNNNFSNVVSSGRQDTDLFSFTETKKKIEFEKPDIVINSAARVGGIIANNTHRTEFILQNLKINMNILESLVGFPNTRLINLGSSCIYPLGAEVPISEDALMTGKLEPTNSPYAMAKLTAIEIGDAISKEHGHKILNLMPTNLYGPNDNFSPTESHVIPGLIYRMHNSKINNIEEFKVWGTGKPLREFLYVNDLAKSIEFLIENEISDGLFNVGSNEEVTIKELVDVIKDVVEYNGEINFDHEKPDGNPRKLLNSQKIFELGWKPDIFLNEGIKLTYDWFKSNLT